MNFIKSARFISNRITRALVLLALLALNVASHAQGDGPRVFLPGPVGIKPVSLTYMGMDSNFNFAGTILVPEADIQADVWALNYNHFFSIKGRLAEVWITGISGNLSARGSLDALELFSISESGFSDPYIAMRVGLLGATAMKPQEFASHAHDFSLYALAGVTLPWGDYDQNRPLNLGTNRWSLRLGLPMAIPFGERGATWLEVNPSVYFYGDNDEPFRAQTRSQDPLYVVEAHLSQNFTSKFWVSLDLRYANGGETTTDGVADDNQNNQWGGGPSLGYQMTQKWSGFIGYGKIFGQKDASRGDMWRARLIYVF